MEREYLEKRESALQIVQLGFGGVGQWLVRHYLDLECCPPLRYAAISDRSGLCVVSDGWTKEDLEGALRAKAEGRSLSVYAPEIGERARFVSFAGEGLPPLESVLRDLGPGGEVVVVDVTAERKAYDTLCVARQEGAHVVMCNKWTLAEPMGNFQEFMQGGTGKVRYETTVGAALPVIGTLDRLLETGDEVTRIEAAISGTLGFLCSEIQRGTPFSAALAEAQRLGYTEPDPRDDLAGVDARRKALILARKLGRRLDMEDITVESLVPPGLERVSLREFWRRLPEVDAAYARRVEEAAGRGNVLRFLANIDGECASVALAEVPLNSLPGSLNGTESLFVYHTRRYGNQPLAVRGRGAGAELTASGVLSDILSLL